MNSEERRQMIDQSMMQLAGDVRFQSYMQLIRDSRDGVVADLCSDAVIESDRLTAAAIGELRCYVQQLDTYEQVRAKIVVEETQ